MHGGVDLTSSHAELILLLLHSGAGLIHHMCVSLSSVLFYFVS